MSGKKKNKEKGKGQLILIILIFFSSLVISYQTNFYIMYRTMNLLSKWYCLKDTYVQPHLFDMSLSST